jgi:TonB family protein
MNCERTAHYYQPTIIESALLFKRLTIQFAFFKNELQRSWPEFKNDPLNFTKHSAHHFARFLKKSATRPHALAACASAVVALAFMLTIVWLVNSSTPKLNDAADGPPLEITLLDVAAPPEIIIKDDNEGAGRLPKSSRGGGGDRNPLPPQHGKLPPPSLIPAAIPIAPPLHAQSLPVAGIVIEPAQWQDVKAVVYGDPNSTSTTPSAGPGTGYGIGPGRGPGIGSGSDSGNGCNGEGFGFAGGGSCGCVGSGCKAYKGSEVEQRARLLQKPEPQYTEEARKNQITGTVMLRAVFSSAGDVVQIQALRSLPFGLTERAIAAARQIKFVPAMKGGQPVSVFMQLEYNFNLY